MLSDPSSAHATGSGTLSHPASGTEGRLSGDDLGVVQALPGDSRETRRAPCFGRLGYCGAGPGPARDLAPCVVRGGGSPGGGGPGGSEGAHAGLAGRVHLLLPFGRGPGGTVSCRRLGLSAVGSSGGHGARTRYRVSRDGGLYTEGSLAFAHIRSDGPRNTGRLGGGDAARPRGTLEPIGKGVTRSDVPPARTCGRDLEERR